MKPGELHKIALSGVSGRGLKLGIDGKEFILPGMLTYELKAEE